jgi:hypothetical protein
MVFVALAAGSAAPRAVQISLDYAGIDEAMMLARGGDAAARARFHAGYRVNVARDAIDFVDVVSPFRRVVIATQQAAEGGDRRFGQRQAIEILRTAGGRLDVRVEMTFHPQNTYISVPDYSVVLVGARDRSVKPQSIDRLSRWTPRVDGLPPPLPAGGGSGPSRGRPLLGGTLVAVFDLESIDPMSAYDVAIGEGGTELARVRLDLGKLR